MEKDRQIKCQAATSRLCTLLDLLTEMKNKEIRMPGTGLFLFIMYLQVALMVGSIFMMVMFVMAHRKMAKAHENLSDHMGMIARNIKNLKS